ncbi:hypothetical protein BDF20DRAFT_863276 [Mycotypha africana]|uniref:uncharacterized protein n=1 Tax=Mycotypha africana TaxID=64632 RepID=UPI002301643A|nr:uncharacterized protein BDF20DRAFT_863276 [Mycotypha africana]KAI8981788.1 hypothetical protein BDF20DRAFT_863276 [Mycotypha africana]
MSQIIQTNRKDFPLLTRKNLYKLENQIHKLESGSNRDLLDRYLQEVTSNSKHFLRHDGTVHHLQSSKRKSEDLVMASPRLSPFPYHNDSLFFPTAEQIQYLNSYSTDNSSSTLNDSVLCTQALTFVSSSPPLPDSSSVLVPPSITRSSTPQHDNRFYGVYNSSHHNTSNSFHSLPKPHSGSRKRWRKELNSLPLVIDRSSMSNTNRKCLLKRLSSFCSLSSFSSASSVETAQEYSFNANHKNLQPYHLSKEKSPRWFCHILKKIFGSDYIGENTQLRSKHSFEKRGFDNVDNDNSVWYCKYKENPTGITITSTAFEGAIKSQKRK